MRVVESSAGGVPLPDFLDTQIESAINSQLSSVGKSALSGAPNYVVTDVATSNGQITLTLGPAP